MRETFNNINEGLDALEIICAMFRSGDPDINDLIETAQKATSKERGIKNILYNVRQWQTK